MTTVQAIRHLQEVLMVANYELSQRKDVCFKEHHNAKKRFQYYFDKACKEVVEFRTNCTKIEQAKVFNQICDATSDHMIMIIQLAIGKSKPYYRYTEAVSKGEL